MYISTLYIHNVTLPMRILYSISFLRALWITWLKAANILILFTNVDEYLRIHKNNCATILYHLLLYSGMQGPRLLFKLCTTIRGSTSIQLARQQTYYTYYEYLPSYTCLLSTVQCLHSTYVVRTYKKILLVVSFFIWSRLSFICKCTIP